MAIRELRSHGVTEVAETAFRSLLDVDSYLTDIRNTLNELDGLVKQHQNQFARVEKAAGFEFVINQDPKNGQPTKKGKAITLDKIDKVVIPKMDVLRKHFAIADEISEQADKLDTLYNQVMVNFKGVRGANETLANIKAMQKSAKEKLDKALLFLHEVGQKYAPTPFRDLGSDYHGLCESQSFV